MLFKELYSTDFVWVVDMDENRAIDGASLRQKFAEDTGEKLSSKGPCNMLEMLVALSLRCDGDIMGERGDDNAKQWFWDVLYNLNLERFDNRHYDAMTVKKTLQNVIFRKYDRNGRGGLFPLRRSKIDQRGVEIWYQLNSWLHENYG